MVTERQSQPTPEDEFFRLELRSKIAAAFMALTPMEEKVIRLRFGFYGITGHRKKCYKDRGLTRGDGLTLAEVGKIFGRSRDRIRQIEQRAIRKLRRPAILGSLKVFVRST